ncbi:MAG: hypothetical protein GY754_33315 [bacterium]|nr:hypothetical protein [bacterium]
MTVEPLSVDAYEVICHFSGLYKGRKMGTSRALEFAADSLDMRKMVSPENLKVLPNGKEYTELQGRTTVK